MFKYINPMYWVNNHIDKRINEYKEKGVVMMQYNPLLVTLDDPYNEKHMTRRILENRVWYSAIEQDIEYFYQHEAPKFYRNGRQSESLNYFWRKATENSNYRKIHLGFPQLISRTMSTLILGNGYKLLIEAGNDEQELNEELEKILNDNSFNFTFQKAIETESWSGGAPFKLSYNSLVSEYPLIEVWQPENYSHKTISGRIVEEYFDSHYSKGATKYRLTEIYGVDEKGAFIDYKLHMLVYDDTKNGMSNATNQTYVERWVEVELTECDETKDLKRISFRGYYSRLSLYKPNKYPNSEFPNTLLGESDYSGSYGAFDAVDEIGSTWIQEFRDAKLYRYFPREYVQKNARDETQLPSDFKKDHVLYEESPTSTSEQKITYDQGELRTEKHTESYKTWVTQILNNAGLSPLTVGVTGLESIDASAESQQEREKVSIRTRGNKIESWKEFLMKYIKIVIEFNEIIKTKPTITKDEIIYNVKVNSDFKVIPLFEDYIIKSKADRTREASEGIQGMTWDIKSAVEYIHDDKTDTQKLAMVANIKLENNIDAFSIAEASALKDEEETAQEILQEQDVEIIQPEEEVEEIVEETPEIEEV